MPVDIPDPVPERQWVKKKTYGKADGQALTGSELNCRGLKREAIDEKAQGKAMGGCL